MKRLLLSLVLVVASLAAMAQGNGTLNQQGEMVRKDHNLCFAQGVGNQIIPDAELLQLLGEEGFDSYCSGRRLYMTGNGLKNGGWAAFGGGIGLYTLGLAFVAIELSNHTYMGLDGVGVALMVTGAVSFVAGNILLPTGYVLRGVASGKISRIAEGYNSNRSKTAFSYNLSPSVMRCNASPEQANLGLGLTFSLNF